MKYLITARSHNGSLLDAAVAHTLLKAQEEGASMIFDLTQNLFSTASRQHQNEALMYDGVSTLTVSVGHNEITLEPIIGE